MNTFKWWWKYERDRLPEVIHRYTLCKLFGHRWQRKMHDDVCVRCYICRSRH